MKPNTTDPRRAGVLAAAQRFDEAVRVTREALADLRRRGLVGPLDSGLWALDGQLADAGKTTTQLEWCFAQGVPVFAAEVTA